ncbi:two-component system phosphate regulon sensor histidine kinase PhoR [Gelidibacter algens]|uniref:histidine kinase n=2 Tax=Gelidibacter algens TaxID=49280 RepID=A0A1A7QSX1_9FLAO|nr:HAMP domain-containing sensor histidine kinase [Gelidibacter algens]OBX22423.1 hypothetical protein A9996_17000 [Gelidibacter algens]RAJ22552.1 two-component system phosphate regulon sensor histidine kinase PhoR [Gelidibacter algens]
MTAKNYLWILYAITATIFITIGVQVYWNYTNYQLNRQRVSNEIQLSLDNALEEYYAEIAKSDFLTIIKPDKTTDVGSDISEEISKLSNVFTKANKLKSIAISSINFERSANHDVDSVLLSVKEELNKTLLSDNKKTLDSIIGFSQLTTKDSGIHIEKGKQLKAVQVLKGKKAFDSLKVLKSLNTIMISMDRDTLEYSQVDSLLKIQFKQKNISPSYRIKHFKKDTLYYTLNPELKGDDLMSVTSKSTYLKAKERIFLEFENPLQEALKLSFNGIFISMILTLAIIFCLYYLLQIIKQQKQLAEVKNDLISNITHEFRTPISTIGVALESLKNFNALDDKVKTQNYLNISNDQLAKLNVMVEKLLETATLDSENLELNKERTNISELIKLLVEKHNLHKNQKPIQFLSTKEFIEAIVDAFHIENAINNIIDNAIKYGGEKIVINLEQNSFATTISVSDTGSSLKKISKEKIFEKFYRVPKGNTHDVKGFGIGLYYTKKIIEKHGGIIHLNLDDKLTTFKICFPNE